MSKFSTGLRTKALNDTPVRTQLAGGSLRILSGTPPATADAAETGTLLAVLSVAGGGTGLTFDTAVDGVLSKAAAEVWMDSSVNANGTGGYWRYVAAGDTAAASSTQSRVQGTIGLAGTDMVVTNNTFTAGTSWTLDYFVLALPTE